MLRSDTCKDVEAEMTEMTRGVWCPCRESRIGIVVADDNDDVACRRGRSVCDSDN